MARGVLYKSANADEPDTHRSAYLAHLFLYSRGSKNNPTSSRHQADVAWKEVIVAVVLVEIWIRRPHWPLVSAVLVAVAIQFVGSVVLAAQALA